MFLVLGTPRNAMNSRLIMGHLYEVPPSYTEVIEVEENPHSDLPFYYLRKGQKLFTSYAEFSQLYLELRESARKGDLYGQCNRTVCNGEAQFEHRDMPGKFYCLKCAKKINQLCGEALFELPIFTRNPIYE